MSDQWQIFSDFALMALLDEARRGKEDLYIDALTSSFGAEQLAPGNARHLWKALDKARRDKLPIEPVTFESLHPGLLEYAAQLLLTVSEGAASLVATFDISLQTCREQAARYAALRAGRQFVQQLEANSSLDGAVALLDERLERARAGGDEIRGETARDAGIQLRDVLTRDPAPLVRFGVDVLDEWSTGGIPYGEGFVISLAAPAKSRKTSYALNWVLEMLRQGHSATILMLESSREMVTAWLTCMLAIDWLIKEGLYNKPTREGSSVLHRHISPATLVKYGNKIFNWADKRVTALQEAMDEFERWGNRLRIYDQTPKGGALSDVASLTRVMERDCKIYGTPTLTLLDHAQRIADGDGDYAKLLVVGPWVETFARSHKSAVALLAQTRAGTAYSEMDQSEVRGGSKLDEMSDLLLGVRYKPEQSDQISTRCIFQRWGQMGQKADVVIDPYTGRILHGGRAIGFNLGDL